MVEENRRDKEDVTFEIHVEHGNPLSLENAHSSLLVVARAVMFPENIRKRRIIMRAVAIASDPVFWNNFR